MSLHEYGTTLPNGCSITHSHGANIKHPFPELALAMHELDPGGHPSRSFAGQLGFIEFTTDYRLPRHVHIAPPDGEPHDQRFVAERIVVLNGVALVEMNGQIYIIPPKSLVTIAPGVPHTWTACPKGVVVPPNQDLLNSDDEQVTSTGAFLMLYEYEAPTAFFPTAQTETLSRVEDYIRCDDLDSIRIPKMTVDELVATRAPICWDRKLMTPDARRDT
jgi:hypothetical protein